MLRYFAQLLIRAQNIISIDYNKTTIENVSKMSYLSDVSNSRTSSLTRFNLPNRFFKCVSVQRTLQTPHTFLKI